MRTERNLFPWPLLIVVAVVSLAGGYGLGRHTALQEARQVKFIDWNGSHAQAEDAMRRWAPKGIGGHRTPAELSAIVHQNYSPSLMAYPTKNCIQLEPDGVGGAPIYCYRANTLDLLEEYSDVE